MTERSREDRLAGALRFILAFYEPGQTYLDTNAWKVAESSARHLLENDTTPASLYARAPAMEAALMLALDDFGADFQGPTIDAMRAALGLTQGNSQFSVFLDWVGQEGICIYDEIAPDPVTAFKQAQARAAKEFDEDLEAFELHGVTSRACNLYHWEGTDFVDGLVWS